MQAECRTKNFFAIACLVKKILFYTELLEFRERGILKTGLFHRVKNVFKSFQTQSQKSPVYTESNASTTFGITCVGKK